MIPGRMHMSQTPSAGDKVWPSCSPARDKTRAGILAVAERKERLLGWVKVQGQSRAEWYLNGHAGGLSATLDDQQEAAILIILLWLQFEHRHLSRGGSTDLEPFQTHIGNLQLTTEGSVVRATPLGLGGGLLWPQPLRQAPP